MPVPTGWAARCRTSTRLLVDHAHCEKKAAGDGPVAALPLSGATRASLAPLSALAREELAHFEAVLGAARRRAASRFRRQRPSPYAGRLREACAPHEPERLIDLLLVLRADRGAELRALPAARRRPSGTRASPRSIAACSRARRATIKCYSSWRGCWSPRRPFAHACRSSPPTRRACWRPRRRWCACTPSRRLSAAARRRRAARGPPAGRRRCGGCSGAAAPGAAARARSGRGGAAGAGARRPVTASSSASIPARGVAPGLEVLVERALEDLARLLDALRRSPARSSAPARERAAWSAASPGRP